MGERKEKMSKKMMEERRDRRLIFKSSYTSKLNTSSIKYSITTNLHSVILVRCYLCAVTCRCNIMYVLSAAGTMLSP